ncbi:MAG TPA: LamG-like jellyroll fold domain-containing protein, partial [Candidatus Angelobacter sp.]|nr:LamG-like jellyroll fold domain-containing protein [Candidatus Angelobacter sp.]
MISRVYLFFLKQAPVMFFVLFWLIPKCSGQTLQHRYSFNGNANDSVGGANGTLVGNVYLTNNMLDLPGGGNSANPSGYVSLPNGIVTSDPSISVEAWLTDNAGSQWAEAWCFGDSAAGQGNPPTSGTAYISLIPHSGGGDFRAAFNLTGSDEIDVVDSAGAMPLNTEEYAVVTYDAASTTARLYLNGVQMATASVPTNLAPSNYGDTYNNWFGRDEFGGDPMFSGTLDEVRIWNGAVSPLYVSLSALAGPNVVLTNLTPTAVTLTFSNTSLAIGLLEQAVATATFSQLTNLIVTSSVTNWASSNPSVLTVDSNGLITAVGPGTANVQATFLGVTGTGAVLSVTSPIAGGVTVAYWQFNNSANLGFDDSGENNELVTATGEPAYSSVGPFGGSLYLDGNSTLTTATGMLPAGTPTNANPFTIAVWEKVDDGCPNTGGFIGWGVNNTSDANNFRLGDLSGNSDALDDYWFNNDFYIDNLASNPADGNWHALAVTWDGTNEILYVDGVNVGSRVPTPPTVQSGNFVVGKTTSDVNFKGWMEDLLIANAGLTPAELQVYQSGGWSAALSNYPLQPTASPSNTVYSGTALTLTAQVAGSPPFQYQWLKNGTNIPGATTVSLVISNTMASDSGNYSVVAANFYATNTSPSLAITVLPSTPPIFLQQPAPPAATNYQGGLVTLTASVTGTLPIWFQWQHNGVNLPNATGNSLVLASLQPSEAGNYTLVASNAFGVSTSQPAALTILPPPNPSALNVLTYHYDNTRQGADTNEVLLTPNSVNETTFGKLITYPTDGDVIAQPLYVYGLQIPSQGAHNTVFVATENDSIYAFDADNNTGTNGGLLWHVNLGTAASSYTGEFGTRYQGTYYGDITPVVGITGTPVINLASGTLYVSVHTREVTAISTNYFHRIHALNIANGMEQPGSPVVVTDSVAGTGVDGTNGIVSFDARQENQRPALAYANGTVYIAYGSYEDTDPYHGWVFGFNATNLALTSAFNTTPNATVAAFGVNAGEGALWMGGGGLCLDASNNVYFATANGSFSEQTNGGDYADAIVKLSTTNGFQVADYFSPYNQAYLAAADLDLGSGGIILLPDSAGSTAHPHLIVAAGKERTIH